ncbi:excalibur calcium-binding domain-containing protein [Paenibacillus sp. USHLN196]|uniref:excalibur calcium-binding domain-containing protein n=1 Tax=Paenibacillus sp. USHLN196 TaxID=3081291 RepID=UPI003015A3C0
MDELYWPFTISALLTFALSLLNIRSKMLIISLRVLSFYLTIFPALHYLNHEIRDWAKVTVSISIFLIFFLALLLKKFKLKEILHNTVEIVTDVSMGLLGWFIFIGGILLIWFILHLINPNTGTQKQDIYFENCSEAISSGYYNMDMSHEGYRSPLDRDNDGIACER